MLFKMLVNFVYFSAVFRQILSEETYFYLYLSPEAHGIYNINIF